jgi:hypothetical protein
MKIEIVHKMKNLNIFDKIKSFGMRHVNVLTDKLHGVKYSPTKKKFSYTAAVAGSGKLLVLGKEHYRELNRSFPIQSYRELYKVLTLESKSNQQDIQVFIIGDYLDGERQVTIWLCPRALLDQYALKPMFIIPESLLLLEGKQQQLLTLTRHAKVYWFYRASKNGQGKYLSAVNQGLLTSAALFKASVGLADDIVEINIADEDYLTCLFSQFLQILSRNGFGLKTPLRQLAAIDLRIHAKYCGITAAVLLTSYLSLSSVYLEIRLSLAQRSGEQYKGATQAVFDLKKQLSQAQQKGQQLARVTSLVDAPSALWRLVSPLVQSGIEIKRISYLPRGICMITGVADKDTEVLAFLNTNKLVADPKLSVPTQIIKGKDHFNIEFKLKEYNE